MLKLSKDINLFSLARRINRPLILDGAMGSLLQQKKVKSSGPLWMSLANLTDPEIVIKLHKNYIKAGADIITTNTFRTNPVAVEKYGSKLTLSKLVKSSVKLAINAIEDESILIAGSNPPAEDCYQKQRNLSSKKLQVNHHTHINLLIENGTHFILNETQSHFDEIKIISKYCSMNNIPYIISLFLDEKLKLLSGESFNYVIEFIADHDPLAIGVNCILPTDFLRLLRRNVPKYNWGTYLNCGDGSFTNDDIKCGISTAEYGGVVEKIIKYSPSFVGACCGSTPAHIKKIKEIFDGR